MILAQDTTDVGYKRAWQPLYTRHGLEATYLFYSKANNQSNGVVLKLRNTNPYEITYSFRLVFRADSLEKEELVSGKLKAGEAQTGSLSGLFWLPFEEGIWISQLGLRDIVVKRSEEQPASPEK